MAVKIACTMGDAARGPSIHDDMSDDMPENVDEHFAAPTHAATQV